MHIVLVHGNFHGAWCWDLLTPELWARGHSVTTVNLPIEDPAAGASHYAGTVIEAIADAEQPEPPVIVGHSMAGLVIPIVAGRVPVRRLVFLNALLPRPGMSANDQRAVEPIDGTAPSTTAEWADLGQDVWRVGPNTATELSFNDVPPDVAAWAIAQLRPQAYLVVNEVTPLTAWPEVPVSSIACRGDRAVNPDWVRQAARDRLGVEPIVLDGGHSPFLSRPAELAAVLDSLAR